MSSNRLYPASGSGLSHRENRSGSGRASPFDYDDSNATTYASHRTAEELESQNDEEIEGLSAKVKMLKNVRPSPKTHRRASSSRPRSPLE